MKESEWQSIVQSIDPARVFDTIPEGWERVRSPIMMRTIEESGWEFGWVRSYALSSAWEFVTPAQVAAVARTVSGILTDWVDNDK